MGRKKIKIARITDDRNRSVTYLKRKAGLMKKAHELAVLTGSEVAVIVFGQNGKLTEFCSGDMDSVLLRYTEHTGPVERKGPENYQNDDDDGSDDGGGGDDDGGDDDDGAGTSGQAWDDGSHNGASGGGTGYGGPSTSGSAGGSRKGSLAGRNQKRKASNIKRDVDAQSTSSGSSSPRRDASPFAHGGPIIRVESSGTFDGSSDSVDRGTLKAAIIQRTLSHRSSHSEGQSGFARLAGSPSRPMNVHHHHSFSSGDSFALQQQQQFAAHNATMASGSSMMPLRPNTAGSIVAPMYGAPRSPFAQDASGMVPMHTQHSSFLSPQTPGGVASVSTSPISPSRTHSAMTTQHAGMTYGDLARGSGGGGGGGGSGTATPTQSAPSGFGIHQSGMPMTGTNPADTTSNSHLVPLAHPILRQHPQFESYSMHLRAQQQHRTPSAPAIHTAPSSPNMLMATEHGAPGSAVSPISDSLLAPTNGYPPIKRSASFGMATAHVPNAQLGQSLREPLVGHSLPHGGSAGDYASLSRSYVNFAPPPPPYALADLHGTTAITSASSNVPTTSAAAGQTTISNAEFNDLMGTILGDMSANEGGDNSFSTVTAVDEQETKTLPRPIPTAKDATSAVAADNVMQSLDSEHSFATLVNTDSFDALFAQDGAVVNTVDDEAMHKHDGAGAGLVTSIAKKANEHKDTDVIPTIVTAQDAA